MKSRTIFTLSKFGISLFSRRKTSLTSSHLMNLNHMQHHGSSSQITADHFCDAILYNRWDHTDDKNNLNSYRSEFNNAKKYYEDHQYTNAKKAIKCLVLQLEQRKNFESVDSDFKELLFNAYACQGLYFTLSRMGEINFAIEGYKKALDIKPENVEIRNKLDKLEMLLGIKQDNVVVATSPRYK